MTIRGPVKDKIMNGRPIPSLRRSAMTLVFLTVALGGCYELLSWSPDGRYLAFCGGGPLWLWDSRTDQVRTLVDGEVVGCRFLPWGGEVLYAVEGEGDNRNLFAVNVASGKIRTVLKDTTRPSFDVAFNGEYVYYVKEVKDKEGCELRRHRLWHPSQDQLIFANEQTLLFPAANAAGNEFLVVVDLDKADADAGYELCLFETKEAARRTLVETDDPVIAWPMWIDDHRIIYLVGDEDDNNIATLMIRDLEEEAGKPLCTHVVWSVRPSLAPKRDRIAVTLQEDPDEDQTSIVSVDLATGGTTPLAAGVSKSAHPVFSPAGDRVAYFTGPEEEECRFWILDLETGERKQIWTGNVDL